MTQQPPKKQHARARPGGGFNQGGDDFGEHRDARAFEQQMTEHRQVQEAVDPAAQPKQLLGQEPSGQSFSDYLKDELGTGMVDSLAKTFLGPLGIETLLTVSESDTPQEIQHKQAMHKRWQSLTDEQQQEAQKAYQIAQQQKEQEEEERMRRQEEEAQAKASLVVPSSPKKGPVGPGASKKQTMEQQLEHQRKTLSQPQGSN